MGRGASIADKEFGFVRPATTSGTEIIECHDATVTE
jgi:hypothetical protein